MALNTPFAGALVPLKHRGKTSTVGAAMIEIRRDIYCDESTGSALPDFGLIRQRIRAALATALHSASG